MWGANDRRSKHFCSNAVLCAGLTWRIVKTRVIRLRGGRRSKHAWSNCILSILFILSGSPNKCFQHTYMQRTPNNNLEIRIADSSCRPQLFYYWKYYSQLLPILMPLGRGTMCLFSIDVRLIESQLKRVIDFRTSSRWPSCICQQATSEFQKPSLSKWG